MGPKKPRASTFGQSYRLTLDRELFTSDDRYSSTALLDAFSNGLSDFVIEVLVEGVIFENCIIRFRHYIFK